MKKLTSLLFLALLSTYACNDEPVSTITQEKKSSTEKETPILSDETTTQTTAQKPLVLQPLTDFLPSGYISFDTIYGDLNQDGTNDCVLITKATDKSKFVKDPYYEGQLDRNRRGMVILLNEKGQYRKVLSNKNCFSSEHEDGGIYFAPDMYIEIVKSKLYVRYGHGRYGHWKYTFRLKQDDFELIGYDRFNHRGPILLNSYSYNFLSHKKQMKENINRYSENPENEVFKESWSKLKDKKLIQLSTITDFDALDFSDWEVKQELDE